jgi:WD40 repeat protein
MSAPFSLGAARVVTGSYDGTAKLWSAQSGESMFTLEGHDSEVNSASFSQDGALLVTGSDDQVLKRGVRRVPAHTLAPRPRE